MTWHRGERIDMENTRTPSSSSRPEAARLADPAIGLERDEKGRWTSESARVAGRLGAEARRARMAEQRAHRLKPFRQRAVEAVEGLSDRELRAIATRNPKEF